MPASSFDLQPTLIGELLQLRPIRPEDFDALFACASDPLIWEQHPKPDRYKKDIFQTYFDSAINSGGGLIVIDRATGTVIGSSRFYDFRPDKSQISIGYTFLSRRYWGGRYNGEMKS